MYVFKKGVSPERGYIPSLYTAPQPLDHIVLCHDIVPVYVWLFVTVHRIQVYFQPILGQIYAAMIRRPPTQIDMTDLDVQDIREHIVLEIAQENEAKARAVAEANAAAYADAAAAATRAMEKERRLGIRCMAFHASTLSHI